MIAAYSLFHTAAPAAAAVEPTTTGYSGSGHGNKQETRASFIGHWPPILKCSNHVPYFISIE